MASREVTGETSEGGARKRLKISRHGAKAVPGASASRSNPLSIPLGTANMPQETEKLAKVAKGTPCMHQQALSSLNSDLDAMRHLVTCKICDRLLYEPYLLSCGHTYCYSCLCTWLVSSRKKTCPDCRAECKQQPNPSYVIREMTLIFVNRAELLPDGETVEQHAQWAKEEAEIVQKDKNDANPRTGGLFKGCFKSGHSRLQPVRDSGDGVDRCPMCHWELEEGNCGQCGWDDEYDDHSGFTDYDGDSISETQEELDEELAMEEQDSDTALHLMDDVYFDDETLNGAMSDDAFRELVGATDNNAGTQVHVRMPRRRVRQPTSIRRHWAESSEDESDDFDDDVDPTMDGFIDDHEHADDARSESTHTNSSDVGTESQRPRRRAQRVVVSDDENSQHLGGASDARSEREDSDSEDEVPSSQLIRRAPPSRRGPPITVPSDVETSSSDESEDQPHRTSTYPAAMGGISPLQSQPSDGGFDLDQDEEDDAEEHEVEETSHFHGQCEELSDREDSDDDDESDDWCESTSPRNGAHTYEHALTGPIDRSEHTQASTVGAPRARARRLTTLGERSIRHYSPPRRGERQNYLDRGSPMRSTSAALIRPRIGANMNRRLSPLATTAPSHRVVLENTLASINNRHARSRSSQPTSSNVSSHSSNAGGVDFTRRGSARGRVSALQRARQRTNSPASDSSRTVTPASRITSNGSQQDNAARNGLRTACALNVAKTTNADRQRKRAISISSTGSEEVAVYHVD